MPDRPFDPMQELTAIRERRAMQRRTQYRKSRLEKYRAELVALRRAGASAQDLASWIRTRHRMKVHRSSVDRYLARLPELTGAGAITPASLAGWEV
jgi:hypothetical protein